MKLIFTGVFRNIILMHKLYSRSHDILWVALFTTLTSIGGYLRIPFLPIPFTLQTLFVYISGNLLGGKRAALSQLLFLALGLMGVPVFAMGGGPAYILQPSFGYLVGFPIAAWIIGSMTNHQNRDVSWQRMVMANGIGLLVIFIIGVVYLYINVNFIVHKSLSWTMALWSGAVIFLPGEILKVILAASLVRKLKPLIVREGV